MKAVEPRLFRALSTCSVCRYCVVLSVCYCLMRGGFTHVVAMRSLLRVLCLSSWHLQFAPVPCYPSQVVCVCTAGILCCMPGLVYSAAGVLLCDHPLSHPLHLTHCVGQNLHGLLCKLFAAKLRLACGAPCRLFLPSC